MKISARLFFGLMLAGACGLALAAKDNFNRETLGSNWGIWADHILQNGTLVLKNETIFNSKSDGDSSIGLDYEPMLPGRLKVVLGYDEAHAIRAFIVLSSSSLEFECDNDGQSTYSGILALPTQLQMATFVHVDASIDRMGSTVSVVLNDLSFPKKKYHFKFDCAMMMNFGQRNGIGATYSGVVVDNYRSK